VWTAFAELQARRPGGIAVTALIRPPDPKAGERDDERWLERARAAAALAPLGHHTHWTSPTHARPTGDDDPGRRVREEGAWLREHDLAPAFFCGGGWYTDASVAAACASLRYADCTPRATRPAYLPPDAAWAEVDMPLWVELSGGERLVALPTTHSVGDALRGLLGRTLGDRVHVYFHDTDLVDRRRRATVLTALRLLGARRRPLTLVDDLDRVRAGAPVPWSEVARGTAAELGGAG
jgi:hypothetical protein